MHHFARPRVSLSCLLCGHLHFPGSCVCPSLYTILCWNVTFSERTPLTCLCTVSSVSSPSLPLPPHSPSFKLRYNLIITWYIICLLFMFYLLSLKLWEPGEQSHIMICSLTYRLFLEWFLQCNRHAINDNCFFDICLVNKWWNKKGAV